MSDYGVRSLGNALEVLRYKFGRTGNNNPAPVVGASGAFLHLEYFRKGCIGGGGGCAIGTLTLPPGNIHLS